MNKFFSKPAALLLTLSISLFLISLSVKGVLSFRQLYYYDIDNLNIAQNYGMEKEEIIKNYDILIDYLQDKSIAKLNMPSFKTSREGEIHFVEVKNIFMQFNALMYVSGILSLLGILYEAKRKNFSFLKRSAAALIAMPILLSIPFAINFDKSFTIFHKIFFNNGYWEFDPVKDPIINVLPQEFFFHCAVLILVLISVFSVAMYIAYRILRKYGRT